MTPFEIGAAAVIVWALIGLAVMEHKHRAWMREHGQDDEAS